jgi:hypothetical protein
MPLSSDAAARRRQLANLRTNAAVTHGAMSEPATRDARERYLTELLEAFPGATRVELEIQAARWAQLSQLSAFIDERGTIRHARRGDTFPAVALHAKISAAFEKQHAILLGRERAAADAAGETFESIMAEYAAKDGDEGGDA